MWCFKFKLTDEREGNTFSGKVFDWLLISYRVAFKRVICICGKNPEWFQAFGIAGGIPYDASSSTKLKKPRLYLTRSVRFYPAEPAKKGGICLPPFGIFPDIFRLFLVIVPRRIGSRASQGFSLTYFTNSATSSTSISGLCSGYIPMQTPSFGRKYFAVYSKASEGFLRPAANIL